MEELERTVPGLMADSHGYCIGHIINLIVKSILFGEGLSRFEKELAGAGDVDNFRLWWKQGVVGRLHNIVKYIMRSDQRRQEFARGSRKLAQSEDELFQRVLMLMKDGGGKFKAFNNLYPLPN